MFFFSFIYMENIKNLKVKIGWLRVLTVIAIVISIVIMILGYISSEIANTFIKTGVKGIIIVVMVFVINFALYILSSLSIKIIDRIRKSFQNKLHKMKICEKNKEI